MRFANRAPLLFDAGGCALTKAVQTVDWKRYGLRDIEHSPVTVFVNLISTHIPYTGAGKQSVADIDEIVQEIRQALMDVGRKFNRFHSHRRKLEEHTVRKSKLLKYVTEITPPLAEMLGREKKELDENWAKMVEDHVGETIDDLKEKVAAQEEEENGIPDETDENGDSHDEAEEDDLEDEKSGTLSDYM
jgi:DNA topoisomerase-6 subunit B